MRLTNWKLFIALVVLNCSCDEEREEPEYSEVPSIQLRSVEWQRENGNNGLRNYISIEIAWQDGDGDLGLDREDIFDPKYSPLFLVRDSTNRLVYFDAAIDTFSCQDYAFPAGNNPLIIGSDTITDTVRIVRNKYVLNFHVSVLYEKQGEFVEFDFLEEYCVQTLGGRFPKIDSLARERVTHDDGGPFVIYQESPWSGTLTFSFSSFVSEERMDSHPFAKDPLKFRVQINDQALNESNIVESEPISPRYMGW